MTFLEQLLAVGPEFLLAVGAMVVLGYDMVTNDDESPVLPWLTALFLFGAMLWGLVPIAEGRVVLGMFAVDNLTYFFRLFVTGTSLLVDGGWTAR